jgi:hypothetical protein
MRHLQTIEAWASKSPERERVLVILIGVGFGAVVIGFTALMALA